VLEYVPTSYEQDADWKIVNKARLSGLSENVDEIDQETTGPTKEFYFNTENYDEGTQINTIVFNKNDPEREFAMLMD
jgi:hypothetical protein